MNEHRSRSEHPNVVLILTDDQGWGDLSYLGNTNLQTPRIDRLASAGAVFDWFYVQPLCAPTRAELLTGRSYPRTGVTGVCLGAERVRLDEVTLGDRFRAAGYRTGCFGKWHSGQQYPYHPNGRGFDQFVGFCCGHWSHYFDSTIEHNGVEFTSSGYLPDVLTDHAIDFVRENRDRPFFCYLPLNTPHAPFQVPDSYYKRFERSSLDLRATHPEREDLLRTRAALAMCENIDWNVGRVVDALDELQLSHDTIVVYLSDNGPNSWRWNGGMEGRKGSAEEGGVRSPCSVTWPGRIAPQTKIDRIAGAIDLLPTLCDLCAIPITTGKLLDGVTLRPLLFGETSAAEWPDRKLFAREVSDEPVISVRTQEFRAGGELGGLYHIAEDIGQRHNLAEKLPGVHAELLDAIAAWAAEAPVCAAGTALPVGYIEFPHAYIPTQDATLVGGIERSSIHPNCSYIINWTDPHARLIWDLDVKRTGHYAVTAMYACRAADIGSVIEVGFGEHTLQATIDRAFESEPLTGCDRAPRAESYEKPFAPLPLGVIELSQGRGNLTLHCIHQAGQEVWELRALKLELLPDV